MAKKEKNTLNEDVDLLNTEDKVSETPSNLVTKSPDEEYPGELSPNPAHSGFTSQRIVDSLPASGELNVLYIVPIKNNGNIVGYKKWTWDLEKREWRRVYGSIANLKLENGRRETPTIVSNAPKEATKVINETVIFNNDVFIKGKTLEDYIDSEGGVTEQELEAALEQKANLSGANFTGAVTAPSIIENMSGYSFTKSSDTNVSLEYNYAGVVKNGNKITFAIALTATRTGNVEGNSFLLGRFAVPEAISAKLFPQIGDQVLSAYLIYCSATFRTGVSLPARFVKYSGVNMPVVLYEVQNLTLNTSYYIRFEATFLLSDNLAQ